MMKYLASILLLWPSIMVAADLDIFSQYRKGTYQVVEVFLCDGNHTAAGGGSNTECPTLDLNSGRTGDTSWPGLPQYMVVDIKNDDCDTNLIGDFVGASTSGGTEHQLVTPMQLSATSTGTVNPTTHRFVRFDITNFQGASLGTCNDFEVILRLFYPRVPGG